MRQHKKTISDAAFSILTLDDDPIITSTIQAYFQRSGYRVDVENDPYQAIERVRQGNYDILLLDFLMTPICGDQVVERIREFNRDIYIILLTGHKDMVPPIQTIRTLDIQGYYEKNDRFDQLELLVESCAKSIRQLRTIRSYKDGLSAIVDSMPAIHSLSATDRITNSILHTASSLMPCVNAVLVLENSYYHGHREPANARTFTSRAVGQDFIAPTSQEVEELLLLLQQKSSLVRGNQLLLPIVDRDELQVGFFSVTLKEPPKHDQIQLMEIFIRQTSSALSNARLHGLLQDTNDQLNSAYAQLQSSYMEMVSTIRGIVDAKDPYTRGHSDRVSYYAVQLARQLGKDAECCERLRVAGLFHDIGKLSVPDEILMKPGRLTDEEFQVIKTHPKNGAELLSVISLFQPLIPTILSHHERIDGRGYPNALSGDEIPEEARIVAVADTFDAMTSNRQYRKALTFQQALDELERCRGTQLDSDMVDVFCRMVQDRGFWKQMQEDMHDCAPTQMISEHAH